MHGRVQAAVRSVCYSSVLGERPGFERASCSCSETCSCLAAEVSSVGAGSGWVFFSGARVIAPTILSRFESLRALLVVWSLALSLCRRNEAGECTRAARLCCAVTSARRAMGSPMRKRKGGGRGGAACRGDVPLVAFVVLAAKATLRGKAADPAAGPLRSCTLSTHSLY